MKYYFDGWRNYGLIFGRSRRREYIWFLVINNVIALFILPFMDNVLIPNHNPDGFENLSTLFSIAIIIPVIAVTVRRLHDINFSGWWALLLSIYVITPEANLVMYDQLNGTIFGIILNLAFIVMRFTLVFTKGNHGTNKYGADPYYFVFNSKKR